MSPAPATTLTRFPSLTPRVSATMARSELSKRFVDVAGGGKKPVLTVKTHKGVEK